MKRLIANVTLALSLAALAISADAVGAAKKLVAGDKAPSLDGISHWIQKEKPDLNEGVLIVEFWATWCAPCKRAIPHLNEMQRTLGRKGLTVVGVAASENAGGADDDVRAVKSFLKTKGDGMSYTIAVDTMGDARRTWLEAAGVEGIPASFIVGRNGRVLWIGNPLSDKFEPVVRLAIAGKYDPILTPKAWDALEAAKRAAKLRNWREAYKILDDVVKVDAPLFGWIIRDRYKMTLEGEGDAAAAKAYATTMLPAVAQDPYSLDMMVQTICKDPDVSARDTALAMKYAEQLRRTTASAPAEGLAAIALVHATAGDLDQAVETQTSAWLAAQPDDKAEFKRVLGEYQKSRDRKAQAKAFGGE